MTAYKGQHIASKWEWLDALRPLRLGGGNFKAVAMALGSHANKDGTNARPGILRLAYETETSRSTAARAVRQLEALGLIFCVERGSAHGRRGRASNYTLTLHDDLGLLSESYEVWLKKHGLEPETGVTVTLVQPVDNDPWAA